MSNQDRIEATLRAAIARGQKQPSPPRLAKALEYAVFPGGARVRPQLCLSVAHANGDDRPDLSNAASAALELIHCASLVHDDLPCFDDAHLRRGKPSVHAAFGEEIAVLAGDALIVMAFETMAHAATADPARLPSLVMGLARMTGMPGGICAGQGWESELHVDLVAYHRAKTGALFEAACSLGALAAGADPEPWEELGARIGEAYQVADDLRDALQSEAELGKPAGQDQRLGRPNAVEEYGAEGAVRRLKDILAAAIASIPSCPGEAELCELVRRQGDRLTPATGDMSLARNSA
ncbi:MAG: polyprenyl synthetase family protein [Pseudomonadota bacterium]